MEEQEQLIKQLVDEFDDLLSKSDLLGELAERNLLDAVLYKQVEKETGIDLFYHPLPDLKDTPAVQEARARHESLLAAALIERKRRLDELKIV